MRFEYYHPSLENVPKLSADGIVPNSVHLSHWKENHTDAAIKADTSTGIALKFTAAPNRLALSGGIELVTNNHFDTDGVLSVWTILNGERAESLRGPLIAAAEAGDFSAYTGDRAVQASIVIQGPDEAVPSRSICSPLANRLAGYHVKDEAQAYGLVLPEAESILTETSKYQDLWHDGWLRIAAALESFDRGTSRVDEIEDLGLSLIVLSSDIFSPEGFSPTRHAAPFTAISHNAKGKLYLIITPLAGNRWCYRMDYPYYSWAETVVRRSIQRRDFASLVARLNELERSPNGGWKLDSSELSSAFKFFDADELPGGSRLTPDVVVSEVTRALRETQAAVARSRD